MFTNKDKNMNTIQSLTQQNGVYLDNITVDGKNILIDTITETDKPGISIYEDSNFNYIAYLDINKELRSKILSKGVFETEDEVTGKTVSIQFYKSIPLDLT